MVHPDKYETAKEAMTIIYHKNIDQYGYHLIMMELHKKGFTFNLKNVQQLMKEQGLICWTKMKKYYSYKGEADKIAQNLLNRDYYVEKTNQKWVTDVTEFNLFGQKLYISLILNLYKN